MSTESALLMTDPTDQGHFLEMVWRLSIVGSMNDVGSFQMVAEFYRTIVVLFRNETT